MASPQEQSEQSATEANPGKSEQTAGSDAEEDIWDEERIEQALKVSKEMHIQVSDLRSTILRLLEPLTAEQQSPESFLQNFSTSANDAKQEVQRFRELMTDEQSKKILEQAKKSRAEKLQGIKIWRATQHPDWLTREA